jgi:hypothetical protein
MRPLLAHCHLGLGRLHERARHRDKAQSSLSAAIALYRELGMRSALAEAETELSRST